MTWPAQIRYHEHRGSGRKTFARLGDYNVPPAVTVEVTGRDGAPDASMRFEIRSGRPECVEISIKARPDGRGIRSSDMRVFNIDELVTSVFTEVARRIYPDPDGPTWRRPVGETEGWAARSAMYDARMSRRVGRDEELAEVARIYREHVDDAPVNAVQTLLGYGSERTAARRVQQARTAGLLPKTTRGRKKA